MIPKHSLEASIRFCRDQIIHCGLVRDVKSWQGIESPAPMREAFEVSFRASIPEDWNELVQQVNPNIPWADLQFDERVSGQPLNPGESYKEWPFYSRDKDMRTEGEKFTHTYMERFWPKYANESPHNENPKPLEGIRYEYGDLNDVLNLLRDDLYTRHAFLPIFFPEDTGKKHRIPCTLGYLFYVVGSYLHITYYIRSCDYMRHLRDDIYMACLLNRWMCEALGEHSLVPGYLTMHIANLHIFANELKLLERETTQQERALSNDL